MEERETFVIKTAFRFDAKDGDDTDQYGFTWYATVEEVDVPVMFNLKEEFTAQVLDKVSFETQEIHKFKSGKNEGKEYRRLKSVRIEQATPRDAPARKPSPTAGYNMVDFENRIAKIEAKVFGKDQPTKEPLPEDTTDYDKPIDLSSIPF
jgi:hypothetical protein